MLFRIAISPRSTRLISVLFAQMASTQPEQTEKSGHAGVADRKVMALSATRGPADAPPFLYPTVGISSVLQTMAPRRNEHERWKRVREDCLRPRCTHCLWAVDSPRESAPSSSDNLVFLVGGHVLGWLQLSTFTKPPADLPNAVSLASESITSMRQRWYPPANVSEYYMGRNALPLENRTYWIGNRSVVMYAEGCPQQTLFMVECVSETEEPWTFMVIDSHDDARKGCNFLSYVHLSTTHGIFELPSERHGFLTATRYLDYFQQRTFAHIEMELYESATLIGSLCSGQDAFQSLERTLYVPLSDSQSRRILEIMNGALHACFESELLCRCIISIVLSYVTGPFVENCCTYTQTPGSSWFKVDVKECDEHENWRKTHDEEDRIHMEKEAVREAARQLAAAARKASRNAAGLDSDDDMGLSLFD